MPTLHLDALSTTALALLLLALGSQLKKRSRWLTRLCVPSPVIAGFGFAFLVWLLRDRGWLDIGLDTSLHRLPVQAESDNRLEALGQQERRQHAAATLDGNLLLRLLTCVLLVMVLGFWLGDALQERLGLVLPSYVGAMFIAIVLRNLDDRLGWLRIPDHAVGTLGDVCLGIFLTMAMMSLKFWELENLGLPLLGVLFIQVAVLLLLTIFVLFRLLGRNYDAAVLCAGFLGHGLGATPNAVANMGAVCEHYRVFSHKAFIIVPLCGAVLIDLVAIPAITWFINAFS